MVKVNIILSTEIRMGTISKHMYAEIKLYLLLTQTIIANNLILLTALICSYARDCLPRVAKTKYDYTLG
jgi:hypothetical protein